MHRVDAFGNSPGVCRKLIEGIEGLSGWHKRVHQKKTETRQKIVDGSRKACRDSDDAVGSHRKFARRFVEGIRKLAGNAKGDRRKEDRRTCRKIAGVCGTGKLLVSGGWTARTTESKRRPAADGE
ncbi:hypothetical protein B296_00047846 [Ensete ventricosum]|uniref:Uncharacterized protein n=1 Tax=Ensete ventricosum TaxID=4639 RepID=A0A426YV88_ENSVE|nr:hypothetical protein B296_00047846 [Ensete ventricosum]